MRRRIGFWADQMGWLLGDVACLALMVLFLPVVPVFKAYYRARLKRDDN